MALCATACDPDPPTEAEARAWATSDAETADELSAAVTEALTSSRVLEAARRGEPGDMERAAARDRRIAVLREQTLPALVRARDRVIGLELRLVPTEAEADDTPQLMDEVLAEVGTMPPLHDEGAVVRAEQGPEVSGRRLGHGVYQVQREGEWVTRRGYELRWTLSVADRDVTVTAFLIAPPE